MEDSSFVPDPLNKHKVRERTNELCPSTGPEVCEMTVIPLRAVI